jgi:hypothetical protein
MIHYHGTPFSGQDINHTALQGKHAMVSFAYPSNTATIAELCQSFCLDNGAYSFWKSDTQIDLDAFYQWAEIWLRHPGCDFAIIPDVINGTEEENDTLIEKTLQRGMGKESQWVPVWHLNESIDRLVRLCNDWPRVALGSSGQYATIGNREWWDRMSDAMDEITDQDGFPMAKLHGLRMLDPGISSYIPFASADSTNVARNIGLDVRWNGPYVPTNQKVRAAVIMDRIENHACAAFWHRGFCVKQGNFDLIG